MEKDRKDIIDTARVDEIINKYDGNAGALLQILLDIQRDNGWLPREALELVSERLGVSLTLVQQMATFYKAFSLVPGGRHEIHVCTGTSCHLRGSWRLLEAVQELTGVKAEETDGDLNFTLKAVNCLGCCSLGPVVEIDGKKYANMTPTEAAELLKNKTEAAELLRKE